MILHRMSTEADAAAQRYEMLVEGWRSIYVRSLDSGSFGTQRQLSQLIEQAYNLARTYLNTENQIIVDTTRAIALEAQGATQAQLSVPVSDELTGPASDQLIASVEHLQSEITIQVERDIAFLKNAITKTFLTVAMSARAQGLSVKAALVQLRIGGAAELNFFFHDRGNRRWPSRKFIRAMWRVTLLGIYNETVMLTLADYGIDHAQVHHTNPNADNHGTMISMNSNSSLPTYAEIVTEIFHPNSEAILAKAA